MQKNHINNTDNQHYEKNLASIIIPCYNAEKYIAEALDSVINQTYTNWECIVVDDHSTDNSTKIVEKYCQNQPHKIKLFFNPRKGACAARNFGATKTHGQFLQFLDSDDLLLPDKIAKQIMFYNDNPKATIPFCNKGNFYQTPANVHFDSHRTQDTYTIQDLIFKYFLFTPTTLFRKKDFINIGSFDERLPKAQEHELYIRAAAKGFSFKYQDFYGVLVRKHNSTDRISNQPLSKTPDLPIFLSEKIQDSIVLFSKTRIKPNKKQLSKELIKLLIEYLLAYTLEKNNFITKKIITEIKSIKRKNKIFFYPHYRTINKTILINTLGINIFSKIFQLYHRFKNELCKNK